MIVDIAAKSLALRGIGLTECLALVLLMRYLFVIAILLSISRFVPAAYLVSLSREIVLRGAPAAVIHDIGLARPFLCPPALAAQRRQRSSQNFGRPKSEG